MQIRRSDDEHEISLGHQCTSADDFVELLRWWLEKTDEDTIGDGKKFKGKPWVRVTIGATPCHLNADTTRAGVEELLSAVADDGAAVFSVVANTGGKVNKVAVGPSKQIFKYFYLYTDKELTTPREL